jgi:hypothetical protein
VIVSSEKINGLISLGRRKQIGTKSDKAGKIPEENLLKLETKVKIS